MSEMIKIRIATIDDAEAVSGMAQALGVSDGGRPSKFTAEKFRVDGFGHNPAFSALIAECEDNIAGYAVFYRGYDTDNASRGVYLADIFVRLDYRRKGVGRALVAGVAEHCRKDGARWMFWCVQKRNRAARQFYRRLSTELKDIVICAAFGKSFDRLAEMKHS
jgi:GNAT superfamily N-acetyltransferase